MDDGMKDPACSHPRNFYRTAEDLQRENSSVKLSSLTDRHHLNNNNRACNQN